jgi:tRNA1Val (adenine37-N6)-methyltransferase
MNGDFTLDGFLGGCLTIAQPKNGFRAGHDSVLLAAAVPASAGERVLELGSGVGVASLCLSARTKCDVLGIEIDPALVSISNENAKRNGMARARFIEGDAGSAKPAGAPFDHVFFNPPFHPDTGQVSPHAARDRATRDTEDAVRSWTGHALTLVKHGGTVTAILRADRLDDFLNVAGKAGGAVLPLLPSAGEAPKRVIVQKREGDTSPLRTMAGLPLHEDGRPTHGTEAVLRHGAALPLF